MHHINCAPTKEVNSVKCFGVVIDSKLTWKERVKQVLSKGNTALAFLCQIWGPVHIILIKEHCNKTSVLPIIEYASTVWAPHTLRRQ